MTTPGANQESEAKYVLDLSKIAPDDGTPFKGPNGEVYTFRNPLDFELIEASQTERLAKRFNELQGPVKDGDASDEDVAEYDRVMTEYILIVTNMPADAIGGIKWWQKLQVIAMYRMLQVAEQKKIMDKAKATLAKREPKKVKHRKKTTGAKSSQS